MKYLHFYSGLFMLLAFVISGQYLEWILPPFDGVLNGYRMMYRASHVYMMMAAITNIMSGIYFRPLAQGKLLSTQHIGSGLIVASQLFLLAAFIIEPGQVYSTRLYTLIGCIALLLGAFLVFLVFCFTRCGFNRPNND